MSGHDSVPVIGLVGGVGSGKSSLARGLAAGRPVVVIDGDEIGHQVLQNPAIRQQIRHRFGDAVFNSEGEVNRSALARVVFGPHQRPTRADLEQIVHPEIRRRIEQEIAAGKTSTNVDAIVLDAAVLFEAGWNDLCDAVVFVDVPEPQRRERVAGRGWNEHELNKREASQWPLDRKRQAADHVLDNSGALDGAVRRLGQFLNQVR